MIKLIFLSLTLASGLTTSVFASDLQVSVRYGKIAAQDVVVYLEPKQALPSDFVFQSDIPPEMSQRDREFSPHILPVHKGSSVLFPNQDSISHHVFSFSPTKVFELELYKETRHDPVIFNQLGVVTLGCNIHDWMLGYIVVLSTPIFQKTDSDGAVQFRSVLPGEYALKIWHPQLSREDTLFSQKLTLAESQKVDIVLQQAMGKAIQQRTGFEDEEY